MNWLQKIKLFSSQTTQINTDTDNLCPSVLSVRKKTRNCNYFPTHPCLNFMRRTFAKCRNI